MTTTDTTTTDTTHTTHTTPSNAVEYANAIAEKYWMLDEYRAPYGWINEDTGERSECPEDVEPTNEDGDDPELQDGWEPASASDYMQDVLDYRFIIDAEGGYRGAEICIALGGPNAWISTLDRAVTVYWGGEAERNLPRDFVSGLDDYLEEVWECMR